MQNACGADSMKTHQLSNNNIISAAYVRGSKHVLVVS